MTVELIKTKAQPKKENRLNDSEKLVEKKLERKAM